MNRDTVLLTGGNSSIGFEFPSHTRRREGTSSEASYELGRARDLWQASARMTGLTASESPLQAS